MDRYIHRNIRKRLENIMPFYQRSRITASSLGRNRVLNHQESDCVFNSLSMLTLMLGSTCTLREESTGDRWFPSKRESNAESESMWWYHHVHIITSWISNCIHNKAWAQITYSFPNFNGFTVEVWKWISNFIAYFTGHEIISPCWYWRWTMWVKGATMSYYLAVLEHQQALCWLHSGSYFLWIICSLRWFSIHFVNQMTWFKMFDDVSKIKGKMVKCGAWWYWITCLRMALPLNNESGFDQA